jgi:NADPH-dependent curcumin reductase CurA
MKFKQVVLANRPDGAASVRNFSVVDAELQALAANEVLIKVSHFSLDPYMRGRMDDSKSYATPVPIGGVMEGEGVGTVVESRDPRFNVGDIVKGRTGWTQYSILDGDSLLNISGTHAKPTTALGVLGMPGFTGWFGLNHFGRPKNGEILVVGAASGPVGSMVGQLAEQYGLKAIGIAGSDEKCALVKNEFGFSECLNHRSFSSAKDLRSRLNSVAADGVDIYFENVGGLVLNSVLPLMNDFGRIPVCGTIAWYDQKQSEDNMDLPKVWRSILVKRLSINGFIILNHWDLYPKFLSEVGPLVDSEKIKYVEDIVDGIENAPSAFLGLLEGKNLGKLLIRVN